MAMPFRSIDAELVPAKIEAVSPIIASEKQERDVLNDSTQAVAMPDLPAQQPTIAEAPLPAETVSGADDASVDEHPDAVAAQEVVANAPTDVDAEQALVLPDTTEEPLKAQPFTTVETDFDVLMNHNLERVGTAKIHYAKGNDQTYELTWKVSATGIVGLLYPDLLQNSQGKITEAGLLPSYYLYKFGAREDKSYQASFNWVDKEIALQSTKGTKTVPIASDAAAGHTQDFLSFMYQFMFTPPLDEMQMYLTNGRKFSQYDYAFEGEETLELKFANVKTYHIQHAKTDSDEKTELWLAVDYRYVPVKIRKTEKDGTVIEQIATKLKFETLENETPLP